eukprot:Tbor_TRINITY_DN3175_c0_g1::TRINITY_DN3175_c0_g1_i1::g.14639::m.14639
MSSAKAQLWKDNCVRDNTFQRIFDEDTFGFTKFGRTIASSGTIMNITTSQAPYKYHGEKFFAGGGVKGSSDTYTAVNQKCRDIEYNGNTVAILEPQSDTEKKKINLPLIEYAKVLHQGFLSKTKDRNSSCKNSLCNGMPPLSSKTVLTTDDFLLMSPHRSIQEHGLLKPNMSHHVYNSTGRRGYSPIKIVSTHDTAYSIRPPVELIGDVPINNRRRYRYDMF